MRVTESQPLRGKVALVTGASRGLGAAVAVRLAEAGAAVAVTARTVDETTPTRSPGTLADTVTEIEEIGGRAVAMPADLTRSADRAALVESVLGRWSRVDILVNTAGVSYYEPASRMADSRIDLMLELQLRAPLDLCRRVLPGMRGRRSGWIVNASSPAARHPDGPPYPEWAAASGAYGATKAALERLTTSFAAEAEHDEVSVNALSPSGDPDGAPVDTAETAAFAEAALALCGGVTGFRTGHVTTSSALLRALGYEVD
jgi:NAD(P)-dependent dehydrogenase (short-subunit alcohol dehydrogenase family)